MKTSAWLFILASTTVVGQGSGCGRDYRTRRAVRSTRSGRTSSLPELRLLPPGMVRSVGRRFYCAQAGSFSYLPNGRVEVLRKTHRFR